MVSTYWRPMTHTDYDVLKGKDVYSADGEKVGTIKKVFHPDADMPAARGRHMFLLDPGLMKEWFGGFSDVYLPEAAIADVAEDRVTVTYTKDQIKGQGWTTKPADIDRYRWS